MEKQTCVVFNRGCLAHRNLFDPFYLEKPERLQGILDRFQSEDLLSGCEVAESRRASEAELLQVVSPAVLEDLKRCSSADQTQESLELASSGYESVFICKETSEAVALSAGAALDALRLVLGPSSVRNGLALCRPPGHHASLKEGPCGFCLANNVVLAAKAAQDEFGLARILIVDWDVHAGNGTQTHTQADPGILFLSIHRYEHGRFWPNHPESNWDAVGSGAAGGRTVNVPLNGVGFGAPEYLAAFAAVLLPVAAEFRPELVLVSCGFDAALGDPEGRMRLSPGDFARMTRLLGGLGAPMLLILEGGYFQASLCDSAAWVLKALLGRPVPALPSEPKVPAKAVARVLAQLVGALSPHWECMGTARDLLTQLAHARRLPPVLFQAKAEYKGSRDLLLPFPTRGENPPRLVAVEDRFRKELAEIANAQVELASNLSVPSLEQAMGLILTALNE